MSQLLLLLLLLLRLALLSDATSQVTTRGTMLQSAIGRRRSSWAVRHPTDSQIAALRVA